MRLSSQRRLIAGQGGPDPWRGTAEGVQHLVLYSGSGDEVTGASTRIANPCCPRQRATGMLPANKIGGEGSERPNRGLAVEPTGDSGVVASKYLR